MRTYISTFTTRTESRRVRNLTSVVAAVLATSFAGGLAPAAAGAHAGINRSRIAVPRAQCASLITAVRRGAIKRSLSANERREIRALTPSSCTVRTSTRATAAAPSTLARQGSPSSHLTSATYCRNYYSSLGYYTGPVQVATAHVNVGECFNYRSVWAVWGPDCYVTTVPITGADTNWCGVYNNGGSFDQPGINFDLFGYGTPWWKSYHWVRFQVYANGSYTYPWGG
jgi:hypothetical protein